MRRKKELVIYCLVVILLAFCFIRLNGYSFSKESTFAKEMQGMPRVAEKILLDVEIAPNVYQIIGTSADGEWLLGTCIEKEWNMFWRDETERSGSLGSRVVEPCEAPVNAYIVSENLMVGLCKDVEIREITIWLGDFYEDSPLELAEGNSNYEYHFVPDKDGFFYFYNEGENCFNWENFIENIEARDANGDVIYQFTLDEKGQNAHYEESILRRDFRGAYSSRWEWKKERMH